MNHFKIELETTNILEKYGTEQVMTGGLALFGLNVINEKEIDKSATSFVHVSFSIDEDWEVSITDYWILSSYFGEKKGLRCIIDEFVLCNIDESELTNRITEKLRS